MSAQDAEFTACPSRIEDYALIGDTATAALVSKTGSIDWLCLPRFDSASCFTALLGGPEHGRWRIAPRGTVTQVHRSYRGDSLILETEFETETGAVRVIDSMPTRDGRADVVRLVRGLRGSVEMELEWIVRFDYGAAMPWVRRVSDQDGGEALLAVAGPDAVCLRGSILPHADDGRHVAHFTLDADEQLEFTMTWYPSHEKPPRRYDAQAVVAKTEKFWASWAKRCGYDGVYSDAVMRSLLTLKAMTYEPTGGIVAAVTTSLPEQFGGPRNWDYRYCWLRDASLTLWALLATGFHAEAEAWRQWLIRAVAGDPADVQILYGLGGERRIAEYELDWLPGYESSSPVRIGNGAADQYQADVVGEVMDALHSARRAGLQENEFSWSLQRALLRYLEDNWQRPDNGIWEMRGPQQHFTHSRVMVWVAFDRGVSAVEQYGLDGPVERWRELRDEVFTEVMEHGWNAELNSFTQYYGSTNLDASLLLISQMGFLPADDPKVLGTIEAVERELRSGVFVKRYVLDEKDSGSGAVDGLPGGEAAFLACSFWLVDAHARAGHEDEARSLFEGLLALRNDVGLLSEEYDEKRQRMAGNFPQAFSHLALVDAAHVLAGVRQARQDGHDAVPRSESVPTTKS